MMDEMEIKIIDAHVHCGSYMDSMEEVECIICNINQYMKDANIDKCILLSNSQNDKICGNNDMVHELVEQHPDKFAWMCNLDGCKVTELYKQLENNKMRGACGIGELMINKKFDDPFYEKIFSVAQKLNMPIVFHMSPSIGFSYGIVDEPGLPLLEKALYKFSELNFIGHSQVFWHEISGNASTIPEVRSKWGNGQVLPGGRLIYLLDNYKNLYCDLSANSGGCAIMRDPQFGLKFLEKYSDRLIFGSDITGNGYRYPLLQWMLDMVHKQLIKKDILYKICFKNAHNLFFT